ncbi:hypothetical protein ES703_34985 [subsurface metagenome]
MDKGIQQAHPDEAQRRQVLAQHHLPVFQGQGHQQLHGSGTFLTGDQPHGDGGNEEEIDSGDDVEKPPQVRLIDEKE